VLALFLFIAGILAIVFRTQVRCCSKLWICLTFFLVPCASNKLDDWVIEWVCNFSPRASSAAEAATETKFGTKGAYRMRMVPKLQIHAYTNIAQRNHVIPCLTMKIWLALQRSGTSNKQKYERWHIARRCRDGTL